MVTMWNIAIGKMNPDGSPSSSSGTRSDLQRKEGEEGVTKDDPAAMQDKGSRGPATSASPSSLPRKSTTTTPWNMQEAAIDKELDTDLDSDTDGDTREEVEYGIVNDQRVVVSKRTKYRIWREFEKGTHNDTCVQPGYWAAIWEFINSLVPLPADHFTTSSSSYNTLRSSPHIQDNAGQYRTMIDSMTTPLLPPLSSSPLIAISTNRIITCIQLMMMMIDSSSLTISILIFCLTKVAIQKHKIGSI
ncbi:hypothetical protein FRC15_002219 [Serendipita sp. 397]|nr:hypothetical protein FRC15_002219 [Serendipita sp. 397]